MKTKQEIIEYCLGLADAYLDYPFGESSPVLRHRSNGKIFALFVAPGDIPMVNLKCEPMQADFWRSVHADVIPGYHMNKTHWNSILLAGAVPDEDLLSMLHESYSLTLPKKRRSM